MLSIWTRVARRISA